MKTKICPFCKEKINFDAIVCRYCRRDLPDEETSSRGSSLGWFTALVTTAVIVSASALLVVDFLKERQRWLDE